MLSSYGEPVVGDGQVQVLGHLVPAEHGADGHTDPAALGAGAVSANPPWSGLVGWAGVSEQGRGAGGVAREPERSRSRPFGKTLERGAPGEQGSWPDDGLDTKSVEPAHPYGAS